ncbi:SdrD B-like domain-containing protein [Saccharothrix sp. NPDC042600]|uniref:SdrD B-like domain-containing protein n=1 Tax=Saccharothrix TaxID=2071 RepID=UPI0033C19AF2|nr:hypothetical protein GCM10017745_59000 [Saccharothrix mutabilis subsp. capreolus]
MSRLLRSAAAVALSAILALATSTGPALATDPPPTTGTPETSTTGQELPDLQLTVWFDKPSYGEYEVITAHARVTNVGTVAVARAGVFSTGNLSDHGWSPPEARVEPGQSADFTVQGNVTTQEDLRLTVIVATYGDEGEANPDDNTVEATVPVIFVRGTYRGTVYGDLNGNGAADPGEALVGIKVFTYSAGLRYDTVTDAGGRFLFTDLHDGTYSTWFETEEWRFRAPDVEVDGTDDPDVAIVGIPAIRSAVLTVAATPTAPSYRVGDVARFAVTLTNTGPATFSGVIAQCYDSTSGLVDTGELGTGVTLSPSAPRTFTLSSAITSKAAEVGHLQVSCTLGSPPMVNGSVPLTVVARVPGGMAPKVVGYLGRSVIHDVQAQGVMPNNPLPGVKVYLGDQMSGAVAARAVSDANGGFTFFNVPAGIYDFHVVGPWRIVWSSPQSTAGAQFVVRDGEDRPGLLRHWYVVAPGPDHPDPDPPDTDPPDTDPPGTDPLGTEPPAPNPPDDGNPAPPHRQPQLADTGVEITWLATSGLLVLAAGTALIHLTGRRTRR